MDAEFLQPDELPDLMIETLGEAVIDSPLVSGGRHFVGDDERIMIYSHSEFLKNFQDSIQTPPTFERAGPRRRIFFDPKRDECHGGFG